MSKLLKLSTLAVAITSSLTFAAQSDIKGYQTEYITQNGFTFIKLINNGGGATLTFAANSGLKHIEIQDGDKIYAFKDMNGNGKLDAWEDWRLSYEQRAEALSKELTKDEIAGLMLFSSHERTPQDGLTDAQRKYLTEDNLRNVLNAGPNDIKAVVSWNNEMQAFVEGLIKKGYKYIPVNFSSDPRSQAGSSTSYNAAGEDISRWPIHLGLAATFNPERVKEFAKMISQEYRAMGITTALGPQIELTTDPRWLRAAGTFGESEKLASALTKAYVEGFQSTFENNNDLGWGIDSVNTMIKHFPGDGIGEGGRESHTSAGKYGIYPSDNFKEHLKPFIAGINVNSKIPQSASMMISYSVAIDKDGKPLFDKKVASAYDSGKIDILRNEHNYNGVLCTDWAVTKMSDEEEKAGKLPLGMAWGREHMTTGARHFEILKAGIDMFGGNNDKAPVLEAYDLWQKDFEAGKLPISAAERFAQSGKRLISMIMQAGLFENPYLDELESLKKAGSSEKRELGFKTQLESIVLLKNKENTIRQNVDIKNLTVYIPGSYANKFKTVFAGASFASGPTMSIDIAKQYFKEVLTDEVITNKDGSVTINYPDLSNVDIVVVGIDSPDNGNNFSYAGYDQKTNSFYPLSLQYRPYTADGKNVRKISISGDTLKDSTQENRSYFGKTSLIANEHNLDAVLDAKNKIMKIEQMTNKKIPVIVALKAQNPTIVSEFEGQVDALMVGFEVSDQAFFEIIAGKFEPNGLLPMQFPKDMDTVEANLEDKAFDLDPYKDEFGNVYDFGFGLDYSGIIKDERVTKFR